MKEETFALMSPGVYELVRVSDRVTFLFLDYVRVEQNSTGVVALSAGTETEIPVAGISALILGPGTSITNAAVRAAGTHGCTIVFSCGAGLSSYGSVRPLSSKGSWAYKQANVVSHEKERHAAAVYLYRIMLGNVPEELSLRQMRGLEGQYVKQQYKRLAAKNGIQQFRRKHEPDDTDIVNISLNISNSILYSAALSVVQAFGLHPALGIIHHGSHKALTLDLADLVKSKISIPIAFQTFSKFKAVTPPATPKVYAKFVRTTTRERLVQDKVMSLWAKVIADLFSVESSVSLLFDDHGYVPGTVNYGDQPCS